MKGTLATLIAVYILCAVFFPEDTGKTAHKIFNGLKTGWEQVQP